MEVSEEYKKQNPFKFGEREKLYWFSIDESDPERSDVSGVECFYREHQWGNSSTENSYLCAIVTTPDNPNYLEDNKDDFAIYPTNEYYIDESELTKNVVKAVDKVLDQERQLVKKALERYKKKKKLLNDFIKKETSNSVRFIRDEK